MADPRPTLLRAVELALAGDWQSAHEIAQDHEGDATADWIHGVVHWMEGDLGNARYWFRQAGQQMSAHPDAEQTLRAIEATLSGS